MRTKILTVLILIIILVIVVIWKRWICMTCGTDTKKETNCKCECKIPVFNPSICHMKPRYWLSGGDADALAISDTNAQDLLSLILTYVTWNTVSDGVHKFLWVESKSIPSPGHVSSVTSLPLLGLVDGVNYDHVDGTEFVTTNLNDYTAICVSSTSSGNLTSSELYALNSRTLDILNFTKQGGSIAVFAGLESNSYDWLPISITTSPVLHNSGFTATAIGSSVGLTSFTMEYPHNVIFATYPVDILTPSERNNLDVTSLITSDTTSKNVCLDKKIDIPDTSELCERTCEGLYKSGAKKNQACDKPAYYEFNGRFFCGAHSKGVPRVELPVNPRKSELNKTANEDREESVVEMMTQNSLTGLKGKVIVTKLFGRKIVDHKDAFMSVFPNFKHGDRSDGLGMNTLSPMKMGPITHFILNAPIANTLEDFWQSSKAYNCEIQNGEPTEEYVQTRNTGFQNVQPQRHKKVRNFESGVKFSVWYDDKGRVHKLSYIESRQVYCVIYEHFASKSIQFEQLVECRQEGMNLNIIGYDGHDVFRYPGKTLKDKFEAAYLDPKTPFGHEMCLQAMLLLDVQDRPWRKYHTINVFKM